MVNWGRIRNFPPEEAIKPSETRKQFPDRKISETFLDFADPFLSALPEGAALKQYDQALKIAFLVWNAVVFSDAVGNDTHLNEIRRLMRKDELSISIIEEMIYRKRTLFGDDHRLVGEHWLVKEDGGFRLIAKAKSPFPGK